MPARAQLDELLRMRAGIIPLLPCIRALQASLTYFSAKRVTTIQSLLARAIGRFLGWETLRDQVSTLGTHDPGAVSFAEAAFRHLSPSVVPWKNISGMILCVFADHSEIQDSDQPLWLLRFSVAPNDVISLGIHILPEPLITLQNHRPSCCFPCRSRETIEYSKLSENSVNN